MGIQNKINKDILQEIVLEIFRKESEIEKSNSQPYCNQFQPLGCKLPTIEKLGDNSFVKLSSNPKFYLQQGKKFNYKPRDKKCHFCGEIGHIKKTCIRKQNFEKAKVQRFNKQNQSPCSQPPIINWRNSLLEPTNVNLDFFNRFFNWLESQPTTIEELLHFRSILNSLIYLHSSHSFNCK